MSLLELIARRSSGDRANFSMPEFLAEQALVQLPPPDLGRPAVESDRVNGLAASQLATLLMDDTPERALAYVSTLSDYGIGERRLLGSIIPAAASVLGTAWEEDVIDFSGVTHASGQLMHIARAAMTPPPVQPQVRPDRPRVLLARTPGEDHTLGLLLVAQEMRRLGWLVRLDLSGDEAGLASAFALQHFDMVGFSAAGTNRTSALEHAVALTRRHNSKTIVAIGGQIGIHDKKIAERVGADINLGADKLAVETLIDQFALEGF